MPKQELKLYYWDELDDSMIMSALALASSKEQAIELVVDDARESLAEITATETRFGGLTERRKSR